MTCLVYLHEDGRVIQSRRVDPDCVELTGSGVGPTPLYLDNDQAERTMAARVAFFGYRLATTGETP